MFPYAEDTPAPGLEEPVDLAVAPAVACDLGVPESTIGLRTRIVFGAPMPVAAINENRETPGGKNKIGLAGKFAVPPPASDMVRAKNDNQTEFSILVAAATYAGHDGGSLLLCENIGHE